MNKQFIVILLSGLFLFNFNAAINQQNIAPKNSDSEKSKKTSKFKFWSKKRKKKMELLPYKALKP